jgi:putative transcriptional regulator
LSWAFIVGPLKPENCELAVSAVTQGAGTEIVPESGAASMVASNQGSAPGTVMTKRSLAAVFAALLLGVSGVVSARDSADVSEPIILVAKPELRDQLYGSTILVVKPLGGDQHVGFIVNRPSTTHLSTVFPGHGPSQKVVDPVYLGGPTGSQLIFAMVQRPDNPGGKSLAVMPGLFVAFDGEVVDRIIETEPDRARFVAGLVTWRPGELQAEVEAGAWYVLAPDANLVMRKPEGLWEELVHRSQQADKTI